MGATRKGILFDVSAASPFVAKSVLYHPDCLFSPMPLKWRDANGKWRTDRCLNMFNWQPFYESAYYVGSGTPQQSAVSASASASELVGKHVSMIYDNGSTQVLTVNGGTIAESTEFSECARAMTVNRTGLGLVGYGDATPTGESVSWTYAAGADGMVCPSGVVASPAVSAEASSSTGSVCYGIWKGSEQVSATGNATVADAEDVTNLVAVFGLPFTVSFSPNGGNGTMSGISRVFGVGGYVAQDPLPACAYSYPGRVFTGWNTGMDGTGVEVSDGAEIDAAFGGIVSVGGQSVTLYAQWRVRGATVTKANADAGGADVASVGTLRAFSAADGYSAPVATEGADHVLRIDATLGLKFRITCLMGGEDTADFPWEAMGVKSGDVHLATFDVDFTGDVDGESFEYLFAAKPLYSLEVSSAHGTVSVSPSPDSDGKYAKGRTISLTISPEAGYEARQAAFVDTGTGDVYSKAVSDNAVSLDGIMFDTRAAIDYAQAEYALSASVHEASASAIASVSVAVGGAAAETAHYGDTAVFAATVADGYSFAGWYVADGSLVSEDAEYEASVAGDVALYAKAKVSVSLGIEYDDEGDETCTLSVNGAAYTPGTAFAVVLGESFAYALTLGERADGAAWMFDCWKSGETVLPYGQSGAVAPPTALSMTARVAASVSRTLEVMAVLMHESSAEAVDADSLPGAISCYGEATLPTDDSGGAGTTDPFRFVFGQTQTVRVTAQDEATFPDGAGEKSFYCFSTADPATLDGTGIPPESSVLSSEASVALLLVSDVRRIYAYYGTPSAVVTTLAYAALSDATMGSFAVVGVDADDEAAQIVADGMSATATQGKSLTVRAVCANGYRFAGWFTSSAAIGDPAYTGVEAAVRVTARRTIYAKFAKDTHSICEWEGSSTPKALVWRSKTYAGSRPFNPSACRVDALGYGGDGKGTLLELTVDMFSAPDAAATATCTLDNIANQSARRLPVRRMERYMQVEVKANVEVDALLVGTSMGGLAQ